MQSQSIGARLRAERTSKGWSLDDVAQKTRISKRFLLALEADDMSVMPGIAFARGFVKTYAGLLHLDADELLEAMPRPDSIVVPVQEPHERDPFLGSISSSSWDGRWDPKWNSLVTSMLWVLLGLGAATGGYFYLNRPVAPVSVPPQAKVEPQTKPAPAPAQIAPPATAPIKTEAPAPAPSAPPPAREEVAASQAPTPVADAGDKPLRVALTATESSWVSIVSDGKALFSGVMNVNERREFSGRSFVKVIAGNAGGVRVALNGKDLEPLGSHGQVRTVKLTADGPQL